MESNRKRAAAEAFAEAARQQFADRIQKIILYGSVARGEDRERSDVDIIVLSADADLFLQRDLSFLACEIGLRYTTEISVQLYSVTHFERYARFSFFENIRREGILIG